VTAGDERGFPLGCAGIGGLGRLVHGLIIPIGQKQNLLSVQNVQDVTFTLKRLGTPF
jgi:hypothetical protein